MLKYCKFCNQEKLAEEFRLQVDGRGTKCRACYNAYGREYYRQHREEHKARGRHWNNVNRKRRQELERLRYWRDPEAAKKRHVNQNRKRRAEKYNNGSCDEGITMDKVYSRDGGICGICSVFCSREQASLDHVTALSRGGTHTWGNVQLAHVSCNTRKGIGDQPCIL